MHCVFCLVALVGFSLGILGLIMVVFDTLVGINAVMVLRPGHVKLFLFVFLDELLFLFGYSAASGADRLAGTLPLRYYSESFARRIPTWRLPERGNDASFLASGELVRGGSSGLSAALGGAGFCLNSGSGGGVKRVRLYRKTPAHLARQSISGVQLRPRVWKRLRDPQGYDSVFLVLSFCGYTRRLEVMFLVLSGWELAEAGGLHEPTSPGSCMRVSN